MTTSIIASPATFTKFRRKLFDPRQRFTSNQGGIWSMQDLTKLWQNVGRTTPAVVGNQVHAIDDISGRNFHLLKNSTNGGILRQKPDGKYYLEVTGAEDYITSTLTHSSQQKGFMVHGFKPYDTDSLNRAIMNNSSNIQAPVGTFGMAWQGAVGINGTMMNAGSGGTPTIGTPAAPILAAARTVASMYVDTALSANELTLKINNAVPGSLTGNTGTQDSTVPNFGTWPVYLFGGNTGGRMSGEWYGGLIHFGVSNAEQQSDFTNYINELTGAY